MTVVSFIPHVCSLQVVKPFMRIWGGGNKKERSKILLCFSTVGVFSPERFSEGGHFLAGK